METTTQPEAYCAEMGCDWQGEIPAIAKCQKCGSNQIRRSNPVGLAFQEAFRAPVLKPDPTVSELIAQRDELRAVLREAYDLMPGDSTRRANWLSRAITAMDRTGGVE